MILVFLSNLCKFYSRVCTLLCERGKTHAATLSNSAVRFNDKHVRKKRHEDTQLSSNVADWKSNKYENSKALHTSDFGEISKQLTKKLNRRSAGIVTGRLKSIDNSSMMHSLSEMNLKNARNIWWQCRKCRAICQVHKKQLCQVKFWLFFVFFELLCHQFRINMTTVPAEQQYTLKRYHFIISGGMTGTLVHSGADEKPPCADSLWACIKNVYLVPNKPIICTTTIEITFVENLTNCELSKLEFLNNNRVISL